MARSDRRSHQTVAFYRDLVQNLKAWQARPPQIRTEAPPIEGVAPSPPDLLPLLPANRMLPRTANGGVSNVDAADRPASSDEQPAAIEGSIQGSVLSESAPTDPDPTPANTGNLTRPDSPPANS